MINLFTDLLTFLINIIFKMIASFKISKKINIEDNNMYYIIDGYQPIVMITEHETVQCFYRSEQYKTISREYPYLGYAMEKLLKNSIGAHYGKEWLMMKKPLAKFFNTQSVRNNFSNIIEKTNHWIGTFEEKSYALQNLNLDVLTIEIMSRIIYGPLKKSQIKSLRKLSIEHNKMMNIMGTDMILRVPYIGTFLSMITNNNKSLVDSFWNKWYQFNKSLKIAPNNDTLYGSMIQDQRYANNELELYQTLYEIMLFNLDIMIDAFANLIWNLATNQDVKEKVYLEIKDKINRLDLTNNLTNDLTNNLTVDLMNEFDFLQCVINETARLNPGIVSTFAEKINEDIKLNNLIFKKGTLISLDTKMINTDPKIWSNPKKFNPSRFKNNSSNLYFESLYHRFGMSPRKCMGNVFSNYILKIGVIFLLTNFDIEPTNDKPMIKKINTIPNLSGQIMLNEIVFKRR